MKSKFLHEIDFSKVTVRPLPKQEGKFIVDLNPAGVQMTLTVSAIDEETALEKGKDMLKKQVLRSGHQIIEGKR